MDAPPSKHPNRWWTLGAVCVATFMLLLDITVVNVALPDIQRTSKTSFSDLQWVVDAYALTLAAFLLTIGSLADRSAAGACSSPASSGSPSRRCSAGCDEPAVLNLARGVQGIGGAAMFATSLSLIAAGVQRPRARHGVRHLGRDDRRARSRSGRWSAAC